MAKKMNGGQCLWGAILMAVGIYFLVWGFISQTSNPLSWQVWNFIAALYYLIGILLLGWGKMTKMKAMGMKM